MNRKFLLLLIIALETLGLNALAHPYASGLTNNNGTISWVLNESATDVQILFDNGTVTQDLGSAPVVGTNLFALGTHTNYAIVVQKTGLGSLNQISSDANVNNNFSGPHGVAVNTNFHNSNFGRVYVANAGSGTVNGRATTPGVYVVDAASGDVYGRGATAATAGMTFGSSSGTGFGPDKLSVGPDDSVYVGDSGNGAIGGVWLVSAALTTSTELFGPGKPTTNSATRGTNFGRFIGTPNVTGSLTAGNLSLNAIEWDLDLCNPPGTYAPSANGYNEVYHYSIGAGPLPWTSYPTVISNPASIGTVNTVTEDAQVAPDGKIFICALRYNTADGYTNVCVLNASGSLIWDSRTQSKQYFGDAITDHLSLSDASIAISPDDKYVVIQGSTNNNFMLMSLTNGVPDISTLTTNTTVSATGGTWCYASTFDAADNIYVTSTGSETLRIFSMGLTTTCITSNDYTSTNGGFSMPVAIASPVGIETQPANQSVACGASAIFTVGASGTSINYQWYQNNVIINNATNASLILPDVTVAASGASYFVVVSNTSGSITSQSAVLTVSDPTPPSLVLIGNATTNVLVDSGFSDPGAQAYDACAGNVPVTTNGTVNMSVPGAYIITYTATDGGGNSASVSRTVTVTGVSGSSANPTPSLIPLPVTMQVRAGVFTLCPAQPVPGVPAHPLNTILVDNVSLATGQYLAQQLFKSTGFQFQVATNLSTSAVKRAILLTTQNAVANLGAEGYELTVAPDSVVIRAPAQAGLFYGVQSFLQLLPPAIFSLHPVAGVAWTAPCIYIEDRPAFPWRGVMLDVARHFFTVQEVKQVIDAMAMHKLNTLHWHLVDDQGWRLQITNYPNLTVAGAFRAGIDYGLPPRASTATNSSGQYGGFYTQADALDVVAYAAQRHITVVPEIEMPCHSTAGLASYPQFGCGNPVGDYNMDYPNINYGVDLYSLAAPGTMAFFEDVLTEVMGIFPSKYIHCGGDEVVASGDTQWNSYSYDKAQMQALGITPSGDTSIVKYQHWLSTNLASFIQSRGRVMMGWSEFENGGVITNAALTDWETGSSSEGVPVAEAGQPVVECPDADCYINYVESSNTNIEPPFIVGGSPAFLSLSTVYNFTPIPSGLPAQYDTNILGAQCSLWGEYVPSFKNVMFKMYPREAAMAELTWTQAAQKNYSSFTNRLVIHEQRLTAMGVNYDHESIPQIGTWGPSVSTSPTPMTWNITTNVATSGEIDVNFLYTSGADGLAISSVALLQNGVQLDIDTHAGFAGDGSTYTLYVLHLPQAVPGATYTIQATVAGSGGTASSGIVYLPNWN